MSAGNPVLMRGEQSNMDEQIDALLLKHSTTQKKQVWFTRTEVINIVKDAAALSQPAAQGDSSHPAGGECGGVQVPMTAVQYGDRCGCGRVYASCRICIEQMPRHKFWGAGEPDCPQDIKASNGELHTMRCKVCGDGWRKSTDVCFAAILDGQGGAA